MLSVLFSSTHHFALSPCQVDNGVIREIFPALKRDDWDVLIGHFLGVDHVGHTFDVGSPIMLEKLDQVGSPADEHKALIGKSETCT